MNEIILLIIAFTTTNASINQRDNTTSIPLTNSTSSTDSGGKLWHQLFDDLDRATSAAYVGAAFSILTFTSLIIIGLALWIRKCIRKKNGDNTTSYDGF